MYSEDQSITRSRRGDDITGRPMIHTTHRTGARKLQMELIYGLAKYALALKPASHQKQTANHMDCNLAEVQLLRSLPVLEVDVLQSPDSSDWGHGKPIS